MLNYAIIGIVGWIILFFVYQSLRTYTGTCQCGCPRTCKCGRIRTRTEGFENPKSANTERKKSADPSVISYQLLKSVMGPIRKMSKLVLDPAQWKERITMSRMTPTELARHYIRTTQTSTP